MSDSATDGAIQNRLAFEGRPKPVIAGFRPFYGTSLGDAYLGDSRAVLKALPDDSVNVVLTSPPYAPHFKKEYGNVEKGEYVDWFLDFAREIYRVLTPDGSLVRFLA